MNLEDLGTVAERVARGVSRLRDEDIVIAELGSSSLAELDTGSPSRCPLALAFGSYGKGLWRLFDPMAPGSPQVDELAIWHGFDAYEDEYGALSAEWVRVIKAERMTDR